MFNTNQRFSVVTIQGQEEFNEIRYKYSVPSIIDMNIHEHVTYAKIRNYFINFVKGYRMIGGAELLKLQYINKK